MEKTKKIWMNGKFVNWENAKIHTLSHGLHYGSGIFEGIRFYKTEKQSAVFRLSEHINRFFYSAKSLEMEIPFSKKEIKQAILNLIKINKLEEGYIRPIAFFGYGKMGLNPKEAPIDIIIAMWPWKAYLKKENKVIKNNVSQEIESSGIKVKISKYIRLHPQSSIVDAKICGHYVNSILASQEIKKAGYDEALFLDFKKNVAEGPGENIFLVKNKKLFTPQKGSILPGITRDSVMKIAKNLGIEIKEEKINIKKLKSADELFFTGTAVEICPIAQIDETLINKGEVGEITKKIKKKYLSIVRGEEKKYLKWLTFVK